MADRQEVPELAGVGEVCAFLGISRTRFYVVQKRPDFPEPIARLSFGPVWRLDDVRAFEAAWPRQVGHPRKIPT